MLETWNEVAGIRPAGRTWCVPGAGCFSSPRPPAGHCPRCVRAAASRSTPTG